MNKLKISGLLTSFGLETFSSQIIFIFIPLLLLMKGNGDLIASITRALAYIGPVILGFYIGSIIDSSNKKALGFFVSISSSIVTFTYGALSLYYNMLATICFLFFLSISGYLLNNLRVTVLPLMIEKSKLKNANSFLLIIENLSLLISPIIASLMLSLINPSFGLYLLSFCFFISSFLYLLSLNSTDTLNREVKNTNFLQAVSILKSNKNFVCYIFAMMGNNAFVGVFSLYIMFYSQESGVFTTSESPYILVASGIGAILSGFISSKLIDKFNTSNLIFFCGVALIFIPTPLFFFHNKFSFYFASFGEGFFSSILVICVWTMRQLLIPKEILGKITGLTSAMFKLSMVISIPLAGYLADTTKNSFYSLISSSLWMLIFLIPLFLNVLNSRANNN
ncbi:hypothetical protein PEC301879_22930 [Pectobacterium carotovorum subsp. carotovorum]|nr:hypothetical protein PEC301879_22930 [Pectobacterium carotovorum subsp. carotovorum]